LGAKLLHLEAPLFSKAAGPCGPPAPCSEREEKGRDTRGRCILSRRRMYMWCFPVHWTSWVTGSCWAARQDRKFIVALCPGGRGPYRWAVRCLQKVSMAIRHGDFLC
jgi:hypothetical protein